VKINPRIESFINTMASSVLIAIIVPMAVTGDAGALAALTTTALPCWRCVNLSRPLPPGLPLPESCGFWPNLSNLK